MLTENKATIYARNRIVVNTDPLRRCYNGCHFSTELEWSSWEPLETTSIQKVKHRVKFWQELNDYAVSQRGESARSEFKVESKEANHIKE